MCGAGGEAATGKALAFTSGLHNIKADLPEYMENKPSDQVDGNVYSWFQGGHKYGIINTVTAPCLI